MQRPLYMRPQDALEYGIIDEIIEPNEDKAVRGRAGGYGGEGDETELADGVGRAHMCVHMCTRCHLAAVRNGLAPNKATDLAQSVLFVSAPLYPFDPCPSPSVAFSSLVVPGLPPAILPPQEKAAQYWIRSGRAESEGRLEQWQEYLSLQVGGSQAHGGAGGTGRGGRGCWSGVGAHRAAGFSCAGHVSVAHAYDRRLHATRRMPASPLLSPAGRVLPCINRSCNTLCSRSLLPHLTSTPPHRQSTPPHRRSTR